MVVSINTKKIILIQGLSAVVLNGVLLTIILMTILICSVNIWKLEIKFYEKDVDIESVART